ncbi:unnamed protein product [Strongylus vulgaris]|uniref:Uncharacterized protein n=1 Tax=Strongylus vulgaris TaxID=40348 RepID=A0A3P7IGY2_STRVU|nr:unnamed protein product [Strongylus vulgaris]
MGLYTLFILLLPLVLFLLSLIGIFFLLIRYIADCCKGPGKRKYAMRGCPSRVGAYILGCGGYLALVITVVFVILLVVSFMLAFASMFICMGVFEDKDLRVLFALPRREFRSSISTRNITLTLHDTLYKCKNDYSFFDAINGEQIWAQEELRTRLSALRKTSFRRKIRNFYVNGTLNDDLDAMLLQLRVKF